MGMIDKMKDTVTEMSSNLGLGNMAGSVKDFAANILKGGNLASYKFEEVEKQFSTVMGQIPTGSWPSFIQSAVSKLTEPERNCLSLLVDKSARERTDASYGEVNRVEDRSIETDFNEPLTDKPDFIAQRITRIQQNSPQFLSTLASSFLKKKPEASDTTRVQDMNVLQKFLGGIVTAYATSGNQEGTDGRSGHSKDSDGELRKGA